ncbi:GTPase Der [Actinomycetota bacterium]|nr:GTPase Der [Actinomycetota bacterium]
MEDRPGVTRDRVIYEASWSDCDFDVMDTGGWDNKVEGLDQLVTEAAELGAQAADAVVFIVDVTTGMTNTDEALVKVIRKFNKPTLLVVNKVDSPQHELEVPAFWNVGLGEPFPVSALHGRGSGDLLDQILELFKQAGVYKKGAKMPDRFGGPRRIAIVGRPNVGKSSLLNQLSGKYSAVVSEVAGTTRDPVDEIVKLEDDVYKLIDTAGIRRRVHLIDGADYYASLRTASALHRAELALCVIDVSESIAEQDIRVINQVVESGRACVIVFNKWDQLSEKNDVEGRRQVLDREIEQELGFVSWAPKINLSAKTGWHTNRLNTAIKQSLTSWEQRIPTSELNAFLGKLTGAHPHPLRGGKQPRIKFGSQVSVAPPRFVLFTNGFLEHQYRRFIERKLRETYGFEGTPIDISVKVQTKDKG